MSVSISFAELSDKELAFLCQWFGPLVQRLRMAGPPETGAVMTFLVDTILVEEGIRRSRKLPPGPSTQLPLADLPETELALLRDIFQAMARVMKTPALVVVQEELARLCQAELDRRGRVLDNLSRNPDIQPP